MSKRILSVAVLTVAVPLAIAVPSVSATQSYPTNGGQVCEETDKSISIPVYTIESGEVGEEKILAAESVANGEYTVKVTSKNQVSVHPDNDIIVRSNGTQVVVEDVESEAFIEGMADGTLNVTDGEVTVLVRLGDTVFSGGADVILTPVCETEQPAEPEPQTLSTSTEEKQVVAPVGAVDAGSSNTGGATSAAVGLLTSIGVAGAGISLSKKATDLTV